MLQAIGLAQKHILYIQHIHACKVTHMWSVMGFPQIILVATFQWRGVRDLILIKMMN